MPEITDKDLYGAIYLPRDGQLDPYSATTGMVKFAKELGVTVYTNTRVTGNRAFSRRERSKRSSQTKGPIKTELVINAAGCGRRALPRWQVVYFPTTPVDHQHIALKAVPWTRVQCKDAVSCATPIIWFTCGRSRAASLSAATSRIHWRAGLMACRGNMAAQPCLPTMDRFEHTARRRDSPHCRSSTRPASSRWLVTLAHIRPTASPCLDRWLVRAVCGWRRACHSMAMAARAALAS